jgi:hypothetical protein
MGFHIAGVIPDYRRDAFQGIVGSLRDVKECSSWKLKLP